MPNRKMYYLNHNNFIKNTYERSKTDWRKQIMNKIEELSKENILEPMNISGNVSVPQNIILLYRNQIF